MWERHLTHVVSCVCSYLIVLPFLILWVRPLCWDKDKEQKRAEMRAPGKNHNKIPTYGSGTITPKCINKLSKQSYNIHRCVHQAKKIRSLGDYCLRIAVYSLVYPPNSKFWLSLSLSLNALQWNTRALKCVPKASIYVLTVALLCHCFNWMTYTV